MMRRRVALEVTILLPIVLGFASVAQAQSVQCEPWVSEAYNNAVADKVARARPDWKAPADPCVDNDTAFLSVRSYQAEDVKPEERDAEQKDVVNRAYRARLNEIIIVRVQHLTTLWDRANCIDRPKTDAQTKKSGPGAPVLVAGCTKKGIELFLDGRPLEGLSPEAIAIDAERRSGTVRYHLQRTERSKEPWADLLGLDLQRTSSFDRNIHVSVGLAGGDPIPTAITTFNLVRIRGKWLAGWVVFSALCLFVFYKAAQRSGLLRDRYPHVELGQQQPYSLAHCQGAWWTGLTLFALTFIWMVTGQRDFSTTALTLLGITAGTALGARVIDASRAAAQATNAQADPARQAEVRAALDTKVQLETEIATTAAAAATAAASDKTAKVTAAAEARTRYQLFVEEARKKFPGLIAPRSQNPITDILSDGSGVSFHRFQMAAWAGILGLMFVFEVLARLAMPEFDGNLLALLGISSGTYLGLKIPEQR